MTLTQLMQQSGKGYKFRDTSRIGYLLVNAAKDKGIKYTKVDEVIQVNDFPSEFEETAKQIIADYYKKKNAAKSAPLAVIQVEVKDIEVKSAKIRKRIPVKKEK